MLSNKKNILIISVGIVSILFLILIALQQNATENTSSSHNTFFGMSADVPTHNIAPTLTSSSLRSPLEQSTGYSFMHSPLRSSYATSYSSSTEKSLTPYLSNTKKNSALAVLNSLLGNRPSVTTPVQDISSSNTPFWDGTYIITPSNAPKKDQKSSQQKALYKYGNQLGTILQAFTIAQGDQTKPLESFVADKKDTVALKRLTDAYINLSKEVEKLKAPPLLQKTNAKLATGYRSVGTLLWDITKEQNDADFINRILIYNKAAATVAKQQIEIINTFRVYQVSFQDYEPGSLFMFSWGAK